MSAERLALVLVYAQAMSRRPVVIKIEGQRVRVEAAPWL